MTGGKRSRCSLPDAACLVGLTSQLDEAMEDMKMMMGTIGQFVLRVCSIQYEHHSQVNDVYLKDIFIVAVE